MREKIFSIITLCLFLYSCEKDVKNGIPEFEPKLVVTSFLSPTDKTSTIRVTSNRPAFGLTDPFPNPENLTGWISDGENKIELHPTDNGFSFTRDEMPIISGKTYNLDVTNDQGLQAKATCTVPAKFDYGMRIDTFSVLQVVTYPDGTRHSYRQSKINFIFRDQPEKRNYYRIVAKLTDYQRLNGRQVKYTSDFRVDNNFFIDKDERPDDNLITISAFGRYTNNLDSSFLKVYLMDVEESYYLYHKSLTDFKDDDNPFSYFIFGGFDYI
jgi:hypothetical protein